MNLRVSGIFLKSDYFRYVVFSCKLEENILVVGGDGRYYNKEAIDVIIKIACAEGVDIIHVA